MVLFRSLILVAVLLFFGGCIPEEPKESAYLSLEYNEKGRLPVSPHIIEAHAKPSQSMISESREIPLRFMILDKRTLQVHRLIVPTGGRVAAPWGGWLLPTAFVRDLVIRDGVAYHGPEGHVNPVVWVVLQDNSESILHEGWLFARDSALTAWDHPRYDLSFLGVDESSL
ncbi:MAG: hypothetical protein HQL72_13040 [Magnetococcales bacterium]|nr:hypothetical protein [Magnetococcales bacterium]